jgi:hypothetical protein
MSKEFGHFIKLPSCFLWQRAGIPGVMRGKRRKPPGAKKQAGASVPFGFNRRDMHENQF